MIQNGYHLRSVSEDSNSDKATGSVTRKRKCKPQPRNWKKNKRANLRQKGRKYSSLTRTGGVNGWEILRNERKMGSSCTKILLHV